MEAVNAVLPRVPKTLTTEAGFGSGISPVHPSHRHYVSGGWEGAMGSMMIYGYPYSFSNGEPRSY